MCVATNIEVLNMSLFGFNQNRVVFLLDDDLSTYKGISRLCERISTNVLNFVGQNELQDWFETNEPKLMADGADNKVYCLIFDAKYLDSFQNLSSGHFFLNCRKYTLANMPHPLRHIV